MTKRAPKKTAKPTTKAKRATKPKPAPAGFMRSAEGIEAETIREEPKLTLKQERFAQAYVENGGNASEAYRTAYDADDMQPETINRNAHELTKNSKISTRLDQLRADTLRRHQVTVDRIVAEYSKLAFANMTDYMRVNADGLAEVDLSKLDIDQAAAIQELKVDRIRINGGDDGEKSGHIEKVTFKLADKRAALDSLSKCLGLFVEKRELSGPDGKDLFPPTSSSRDIARAVLDVLREARIEGQEPDEEPSASPEVAAAANNLRAAAADTPTRVLVFNQATGTLE